MSNAVIRFQANPVDTPLQVGLKDLWYSACPSVFVKDTPISLRRLGDKIALWRDHQGGVHALEDIAHTAGRRCRWASTCATAWLASTTASKCAATAP